MPASLQALSRAKELIEEFSRLVSLLEPLTAPSNFASLKDAVIQKDMADEVTRLQQLLSGNDFFEESKDESAEVELEALKTSFKALLQERLLTFCGTALSMFAMPNGHTNNLYFQLTLLLFKPQNLAELCELLSIKTSQYLELIEAPLPFTSSQTETRQAMRHAIKNQPMILQAAPFNDWAKKQPCPQSTIEFSNYLFVEGNCLSLKDDILSSKFHQHQKLYSLLKAHSSDSHKALYSRNVWFKALEEDILTVQEQGQTPRDAITQLKRGLTLGGTTLTGQEFASSYALEATGLFCDYLERCPEALRNQLKALRNKDGASIQGVINHLAAANCVGQASRMLAGILENPENEHILNQHHGLTDDALNAINNKYKPQLDELTVGSLSIANLETNVLPLGLSSELIGNIQLEEGQALFTLLINFPEGFYSALLRHLDLSTINATQVLIDHWREGFFNQAQSKALFKALSENHTRFRNSYRFLWEASLNAPELLEIFIQGLPELDRLAAVKGKDIFGCTVLHKAANNPTSLEKILTFLPEPERLAAVKEKDNQGRTVLHEAANSPASLEKILALYPEPERLAAVKEKDNHGRTVLHKTADNPESLEKILGLYLEPERLAAVKEKDNFGSSVLHFAAYNPASLEKILALYLEPDRLAAVKEKDNHGRTVLHKTADNPESLEKILGLYLEPDRLAAVKEKDNDGCTILHFAAYNPASLDKILALLPEPARFSAVKERDNQGRTVLHRAATNNNPESLEKILALLPEPERLVAVKEKDNGGRIALHWAADNPLNRERILALLPMKDVVNLIRQKEIAHHLLPETLKNNKEIIIAAKYPALDFILQNAEYTAAASGAITLAVLEYMAPQWPQGLKAATSSVISLTTYAGIKFFTPNLSQTTPDESLDDESLDYVALIN